MAVREERTGFRDHMWISTEHRKFGISQEAVDLDFPMIESRRGLTHGLNEYKEHSFVKRVERSNNLSDCTYRAIVNLANPANIGAYLTAYWREYAVFCIIALNYAGVREIGEEPHFWSERQYAVFQNNLRMEPPLDKKFLATLSDRGLPNGDGRDLINWFDRQHASGALSRLRQQPRGDLTIEACTEIIPTIISLARRSESSSEELTATFKQLAYERRFAPKGGRTWTT